MLRTTISGCVSFERIRRMRALVRSSTALDGGFGNELEVDLLQ